MITDGRITLRAPEPSDVDAMFRWENDATSWTSGRTRAPLSRHALWEYVDNYTADITVSDQARFIITDVSSSQPVGCIDLYDLDMLNRRAGVGIYIDASERRKGYGRLALDLLCGYAQRELGLHQLMAVIVADNQPSRSLFRESGFKECGRLRSWVRCGEHYTDAFVVQRLLIE